jgi:hypothetical protein
VQTKTSPKCEKFQDMTGNSGQKERSWTNIQKEIPFMTWTVKTGALLIAQIHGYLLGLKSIKTFIVGLQQILIYMQ